MQVSLGYDKNGGYFIWRRMIIYDITSYLAQFFIEWEMFQTEIVEKIKIHILCSIRSPSTAVNRAVYVIMWENVVQPEM